MGESKKEWSFDLPYRQGKPLTLLVSLFDDSLSRLKLPGSRDIKQHNLVVEMGPIWHPWMEKMFGPSSWGYLGEEAANPALLPVSELITDEINRIVDEKLDKFDLKPTTAEYTKKPRTSSLHQPSSTGFHMNPRAGNSPAAVTFNPSYKTLKFAADDATLEHFYNEVVTEIDKLIPAIKKSITDHRYLEPFNDPSRKELDHRKGEIERGFNRAMDEANRTMASRVRSQQDSHGFER